MELQEKLTRASKDKNAHYIFLDKNFPPGEQVQLLTAIKAFEANGVEINKIAVVPKIKRRFQDYPFSLTFFLQCYLRCLGRKGHLTISNEDPERIVKILTLFFKQFKEVKLDNSLLRSGFDQVMPISLTVEDELFQLPSQIEKLASQIIDKGLPDSEPQIASFCKTVDVYRQVFGLAQPSSSDNGSELAHQLADLLKAPAQEKAEVQKPQKALRQADKNIRNVTIVEKDNEDSEGEAKPKQLKTPATSNSVAKKETASAAHTKEETKKQEPPKSEPV